MRAQQPVYQQPLHLLIGAHYIKEQVTEHFRSVTCSFMYYSSTAMSNPALLFFLSLSLASCCNRQGTFHLDGYIADANNGDTIIIARQYDGGGFEELARCIVEGGEFHIRGNIDCCEPVYLRYNTAKSNVYPMFFIEEGRMKVSIDSSGCRVSGTPMNDLNNGIEDTTKSYISQLEEIEGLYYSKELNEKELIRLGLCGLELQEKYISYLRGVIEENIHTPLGLYLLSVYNSLFSAEEFCSLFERIPHDIVNGGNRPFYAAAALIAKEYQNAFE